MDEVILFSYPPLREVHAMKPTMEHRKRPGRPRSTCLWAVFLAAAVPLHAGGSGAFPLDLRRDLAIVLPGAGVFACGQLIARNADRAAPAFGWIDDGWTFPYNDSLDRAGDIASVAAVAALPLLLDAFTAEDIGVIAVLYAESAVWTLGVKNILKEALGRPRPYLFHADTPASLLSDSDPDGERYESFPSGHTAFAFMTASFITYVYSRGTTSKTSKILVGAGTFALASGTALLRVVGGMHYPSDVVAGALIGTAAGILVPALHTRKTEGWSLNVSAGSLTAYYAY